MTIPVTWTDDHHRLGWWRVPDGFELAGPLVAEDGSPVRGLSLVAASGAVRLHRPVRGRPFLQEFAKLADGDGAAVLRYADRYGWLGRQVRGRDPKRPSHTYVLAEPVTLWREEAAKVRDLLRLEEDLYLTKRGQLAARPLTRRLEWMRGSVLLHYGAETVGYPAAMAQRHYRANRHSGDAEAADLVRDLMATAVAAELRRAHVLDGQARPDVGMVFPPSLKGAPEVTPLTLRGALYLQLMRAPGRGLAESVCPECGQTFRAARPGHTYCGATCRQRAKRARAAAGA